MNRRVFAVWLFSLTAMLAAVYFVVDASVERTRLRYDASVAKAQEHTKRAEGRHQLLDFLGLVRKAEEKAK